MNLRSRAVCCQFFVVLASPAFADYESSIESMNPIAYWRFEESSGTTASDEQGLEDGTYSGSPTLGASGHTGLGSAVEFSGNDWVEIPHDATMLINEGTISAWFSADNASGTGYIFSKDSSGYDDGGHISMYVQGGRLKVRFQDDTTSYTVQSASSSINDDQWHHATFTFGPDGMELYLDGVSVDTDSYTGGMGTNSGGTGNAEPIAVGAGTIYSGDGTVQSLNNYFVGSIDEVAFFDDQLSAGLIQILFQSVTPADIPYTTDFEGTVGDEWTDQRTASSADLTTFLGHFGRESGIAMPTSLYVNTTIGTEYTVTFDLNILNGWEDAATSGTDYFTVSIDGTEVMNDTFDRDGTSQSYASPADVSGSNLWGGSEFDAVFRDVELSFTAASSVTEITFASINSGDITGTSSESWGIDNVSVVEDLPVYSDVTSARSFGVDTNASLHDGSGWHWADFDLDGDLDAFVNGGKTYLLRYNDSTGVYTSYSFGNFARGSALFDPDGDGDPDVFNADNSHFTVFENLGGLMADRGNCNADGASNAEGALAIDIDADGTCEIVLLSHGGNFIATNMGAGYLGHSPVGFEDAEDPSIGLNDSGDYGNGDFMSTADLNNDGYLDIFFNYGTGKLFISDGDGTYTEAASGISTYVNNNYKFGSAWGDYDNDGDMDLFTPDARSSNAAELWRNASAGASFSDVASAAGITSTEIMRSAAWGDFDNDGDLDLYIPTGSGTANLLYSNDGDGTFTLVDEGAALTENYQDAVFVDYDSDGDLDIALTRIDGDGKTVLLENGTDNDEYLKVRLLGGSGINTLAIGSRIELYDDTGTTLYGMREIGTARGFGGTEPLWAHFGGVDPDTTYQVRVIWPGGEVQNTLVTPSAVSTTIGSTTVDQMVTITGSVGGAKFVRWREADPTE